MGVREAVGIVGIGEAVLGVGDVAHAGVFPLLVLGARETRRDKGVERSLAELVGRRRTRHGELLHPVLDFGTQCDGIHACAGQMVTPSFTSALIQS